MHTYIFEDRPRIIFAQFHEMLLTVLLRIVKVMTDFKYLVVSSSQNIDDEYIDGLAQDCSNSSASAMELLQSCTEPSIYSWWIPATLIHVMLAMSICEWVYFPIFMKEFLAHSWGTPQWLSQHSMRTPRLCDWDQTPLCRTVQQMLGGEWRNLCKSWCWILRLWIECIFTFRILVPHALRHQCHISTSPLQKQL